MATVNAKTLNITHGWFYFAGRRFGDVTDRAGSVISRGGARIGYHPYGEEKTSTGSENDKFATYFRDQVTNLDYAHNRYYSSQIGRFTTPDQGAANPKNPQSRNRYSYAWNDPVNMNDVDGMASANISLGEGSGCVMGPFVARDGGVDASNPCPPGYVLVTGGPGTVTKSPTRRVMELMDGLAPYIDDWGYASEAYRSLLP